jgi:hypothetical protein
MSPEYRDWRDERDFRYQRERRNSRDVRSTSPSRTERTTTGIRKPAPLSESGKFANLATTLSQKENTTTATARIDKPPDPSETKELPMKPVSPASKEDTFVDTGMAVPLDLKRFTIVGDISDPFVCSLMDDKGNLCVKEFTGVQISRPITDLMNRPVESRCGKFTLGRSTRTSQEDNSPLLTAMGNLQRFLKAIPTN